MRTIEQIFNTLTATGATPGRKPYRGGSAAACWGAAAAMISFNFL